MTPRFESAIRTAANAHRNQTRKSSNLPYIIHPFSVMMIAQKAEADEDTLIACLFHDIIEDVPEEYPEQQMRDEFGDRVVDIVLGVTKDETIPGWQDRSDAYLANLQNNAPIESITVAAADKIHNLMSMINDYETSGEQLWARFAAGKEAQLWWYTTVLEVIKSRSPEHSLIQDYEDTLSKLRQLIGTA